MWTNIAGAIDHKESNNIPIDDVLITKIIHKEMADYSEMIRTCGNNEAIFNRVQTLKHFIDSNAPKMIDANLIPEIVQNFLKENNFSKKGQIKEIMQGLKKTYGSMLDYSKVSDILKLSLT